MSFSTDIKNEVTRLDSTREELISELSAIVRNSALIDKSIVITIENNSVARRIFKLFNGRFAFVRQHPYPLHYGRLSILHT